uniref:Uncharacterized protein MANES_01G132600 n=1 Tax=Rhizophora mucronata TaxID=61149 RepID=A0A2P2LEH9_RHIMU
MEENQLDFNQPLLSVRRFASTASASETGNKRKSNEAVPKLPPLPVYKSELKSGPVMNPGTVPFEWEQTPGRPKNGSKPQTKAPEKPPVVPKLPPGRILNVKLQKSDKGSEGTAAFRSQSRNVDSSCWNIQSLDTNVSKEESSKQTMEEMYSRGSENSHEAYVDAVDTLSQTESFFYNCSISGVSGLDGPALKPSGTYVTDPQTLDFMMGRFLPAAKAVASKNPHYSARKQPVARQQPRQIDNRVINAERRHTLGQNSMNTIPYHGQSEQVEESEDEDSDPMEHDNSSPNVCGLFPWLRLQDSFCLLNPVLGMRKQAHPPVSSVQRTKAKSSYASCGSETEIKHDGNAVYAPRSVDRIQPTGLRGFRTELKSASNQITCTRDSKKLSGSPLRKRWKDKSASPSHSAVSQNDIHEEKGNPEISKDPGVNGPNQHAKWGRNFQKLLAIQGKEWESESASPVAEKTLYIDYVHMVEAQNLNSSPSGTKIYSYKGNGDVETANASEIEETASMDSSVKDGKHSNVVGEKAKVQPESSESVDSGFLSLSGRSIHDVQMDVINDSKTDRALEQMCITFASLKAEKDGKIVPQSGLDMEAGNLESSNGLVQDSIALGGAAKLVNDGKNEAKSQLITKTSDQETRPGSYSLLSLPPPSPKSPSESWLKHALPAVRNSSIRSYPVMHAHPSVHASKTQFSSQKWETIVKSSSVQCGNSRVSEELLAPIPEA